MSSPKFGARTTSRHTPIDETPISAEAKTHLQRDFTRIGNQRNVKGIIYYILKHPKVAEDYGKYQLIVGTHRSVNGWIVLWARGDTIVKARRGGLNRPKTAVGVLQNPIRVTTPDGRTMTVDPADKSLTVHMPKAEEDATVVGLVAAGILAPLIAAVVVASPADEATAGRYVLDELIENIDLEDLLGEEDDPPLVPDGGTENRPPGYDALREQGVPEATIEKWERKGYDLRQMSDALETYKQYKNSGETLSSNIGTAKGRLAEILYNPRIGSKYSVDYTIKSSVGMQNFAGSPEGDLDYVVMNSSGTVIAAYEVKSVEGKNAIGELENYMSDIDSGQIEQFSHGLTREQFVGENETRDIDSIDLVSVGPGNGYDESLPLSEEEIKALAEAISNQTL